MTKSISRLAIAGLIAGIVLLSTTRDSQGQEEKPDDGFMIKTADGLKLWGKWFSGGKGNKSDTVIMVHAYGRDGCSKSSQWDDLAKALQKEDFSVLTLDLRGHGESAKNRALADWREFCEQPYNRLAGYGLNPKSNVQEIKQTKPFQLAYYPYLINDLAAARRFIDTKNDSGSCNSGRIFIIAEGSIAPLVMLHVSTEFLRNAVFAAVIGANVPEHPGGRDYAGLIFLSASNGPNNATSTFNLMRNAIWKRPELWQERLPVSDRVSVFERLKEKVSMMFIYSKDDKDAALAARGWFNQFGIPSAKKDDGQLRKYLYEVPAEKLSGIKLMDVMVEEKVKKNVNGKEVEEVVKVPMVQQQIISFIKGTVANGKNGDIHKMRNVGTEKLYPVPLDMWGLRLP